MKKITVTKFLCTGCNYLISKELGGSNRFPKKFNVYYCRSKGLDSNEVDFIGRNKCLVPSWCPIKKRIRVLDDSGNS